MRESRQSLGQVLNAETVRLLRKGGVPLSVLLAVVIGLLTGTLTMVILRSLAQGPTKVAVTSAIEVGAFTTALILSVAAVFAVGRDYSGHFRLALSQVPNRGRLFGASILSWACMTAAGTLIVTGILGVLNAILTSGSFWVWSLLGVVAAVTASVVMVVIAVFLTHLVGRSFGAVLLLVGVNLLLPLAVFAVGSLIPSAAGDIVTSVVELTPTPLFIGTIGISSVESLGTQGLFLSQVGLVVWAAATGLLAYVTFRRRDW